MVLLRRMSRKVSLGGEGDGGGSAQQSTERKMAVSCTIITLVFLCFQACMIAIVLGVPKEVSRHFDSSYITLSISNRPTELVQIVYPFLNVMKAAVNACNPWALLLAGNVRRGLKGAFRIYQFMSKFNCTLETTAVVE